METKNISEELDKKLILRDYRKLLRYSQSVISKDALVLIKKAFKIIWVQTDCILLSYLSINFIIDNNILVDIS